LELEPESVADPVAVPEPVAVPVPVAVADPVADPTPSPSSPPASFGQDAWAAFVGAMRSEYPALAGFLDHGQVLGYADGRLRVGFSPESASLDEAVDNHLLLRELLTEHVGDGLSAIWEETEHVESSPFQRRKERHAEALEARQLELMSHPAVAAVVDRFQGTVRSVEVDESGLEEGL
jgi:hypothetical protein